MNKRNQNHNLISTGMILGQIKGMCIKVVLLCLVLSLIICAEYKVGCEKITDKYNTEASSIKTNSAQSQIEGVTGEINQLKEEIQDIESGISNNESYLQDMEVVEIVDTRIHDITDYILNNKTSGITIILMEDMNTFNKYSGEGESMSEQNEPAPEPEESEEGSEAEEVEETEPMPEPENNEDDSMLEPDEYEIEPELIIRGFATDMNTLDEYAKVVGQYEGIREYRVDAVEAVQITDYTIYLFSMHVSF